MIPKSRTTAVMEGDFVVFLIGMRINQLWKVGKWLPVVMAMGRMLKELEAHPEMGLLHVESWLSRTIIQVQYWRSLDHLMAYARDTDLQHLPARAAFNRLIRDDGSVGIWHEIYPVSAGTSASVYRNMPAFGLKIAAGPTAPPPPRA